MALLQLERDPGVPKLTAGARYLRKELSANGLNVFLSDSCLKDFVLSATEALAQTQTRGEPYISCLCRHLDARARFILLWTTSEEVFDRKAWSSVVAIARKHALPRAGGPARMPSDA